MKALRKKWIFYLLSFTWGLPLTAAGCIVALFLTLCGYKSRKFGYCRYFEVGKNWGGQELGVFFIKGKNCSDRVSCHEHGHALQNCVLGPFMPFAVCIPSALRYWWRIITKRVNPQKQLTDYDSVWFEKQATEGGRAFIMGLNSADKK